ncbi:transcription factor bHLH168-like [Rhodamnia argentea]|uniref:Transcription factor bHLH168-like n=1 Tax=Rhodamnia argentea TaxID=178133 RepID=A0A8B8P947_9MYRT|nr:transcription factor bHLH168-like [Rhodamnia argentea]
MKKKSSSSSESVKLDRKTVERNRRIHMKGLCFKLASLVPPHHHHRSASKDMPSQQDQIEQAAEYIAQLKERIEKLQMKKELVAGRGGLSLDGGAAWPTSTLPVVNIRDWDSGLEVTLISRCGTSRSFMLYEVISILEEEGAEVVSASISHIGDKVFHTLHAQVRLSRVGVETSRVSQRLHELVYSF